MVDVCVHVPAHAVLHVPANAVRALVKVDARPCPSQAVQLQRKGSSTSVCSSLSPTGCPAAEEGLDDRRRAHGGGLCTRALRGRRERPHVQDGPGAGSVRGCAIGGLALGFMRCERVREGASEGASEGLSAFVHVCTSSTCHSGCLHVMASPQ